MIKIAQIIVKDKQAFSRTGGVLRFLGSAVDIAKKIKDDGFKLIHIVDEDALSGSSTNLDVYDTLTCFINVQVEGFSKDDMIKKLLSLRCRVVFPPEAVVSKYSEKNLLVAKIKSDYSGSLDGFHDVIIENADDFSIQKFSKLGKRIIIYSQLKTKEKVWGKISNY
ncbi:MAG: hypothetical protein ABH983_04690 [Candidatus Micrarchaeota archaeon]|nr:hypothetical protein [Candidatus Micrarchaeota archaeon]MBU1681417.1 hypothetical protein [Candidatus Micrarchaeota archaeon]